MRPLTIDGVPQCASCHSEFIEILDAEINPDPMHELPLPPPVRPGRVPPPPYPPPGNRPIGPGQQRPQQDDDVGGGLLGGILGLFGGGGPTASADMPQPPRGPGQQRGGGRSFEWNIGNGAVRVQGFSGPVRADTTLGHPAAHNPWVGGYNGAPGREDQGLDAFFRGFGAPSPGVRARGGGARQPDHFDGEDILQALMQIIMDEGMYPFPAGTGGQMGDYVMTERGFDDILERLMQAAGPQGPLPASQETIRSLERFTFDEKTLAASQYKDCPVCMDDFKVGDAAMKIPCGHEFHPDCLTPWLETNGSCPVCRHSLVPGEGESTPATGAQQPPHAGPSNRSSQPPPPSEPIPPASSGVLSGAQGAITSVLNRLFGQAGTTDPPPAPADIHRPSSRPQASSSSIPQASAAQANATDDPPEQRIDFDTPIRTGSSVNPRRPLPEWAQMARGGPRARYGSPPPDLPPSPPRPTRQSPPLPASSGGSSTFGQGGLVPQGDLFDSDVAQFRATRAACDVKEIPWNAPNHQHVGVRYVLLGDETEVDEPRLFCHAPGSNAIGDFGLLQLRRVAGRAEEGPIREGRMCCHVVEHGVPGEAAMGRIMRECGGVSDEPAALSYSGVRPSSISAEDVD
ncbi:hypothetical protein CC85DRAFT_184338 [Cutaneotrichosporon oleaginosum]|uniref:RING-type E3 ubiquitin transferase n=2 Tax=Cutaneotrichosporon oleaginosum TaxID=879819 RepID=A0A0J1AWF6_9TREE|nr:uncharacterized protein CC85DRAFT_184338 [Cutaneotrichosporon oleaginosum]KLT39629.1 hypothetical protein CC85DRAFT_184338 [Cutaneotrichosporon oleaginosum]